MSAGTAAARGRAAAADLYTDTFAAYSPNGTTTDANGYEVPAFTSQGSTPGKVQGPSSQKSDTATRMVTVGGVERPVMSEGLHIPIGATAPTAGWEYVHTVLGPVSDPSLLNRRYRVVNSPAKSNATARRLDVVQVSP